MREWKNFEEERAGARGKALALLADMDRTESVLKEKLFRAGFSEEAALDALTYVKNLGYLDVVVEDARRVMREDDETADVIFRIQEDSVIYKSGLKMKRSLHESISYWCKWVPGKRNSETAA